MTSNNKTYKRELAIAMLLFLAALFLAGITTPAAMEAAMYLTTYVFIYVGAAFGVDAYSKQIK